MINGREMQSGRQIIWPETRAALANMVKAVQKSGLTSTVEAKASAHPMLTDIKRRFL